ncbi:hypothetical protein BCM02_101223 [Paenibacillus methanolicus]|uniref:Uncharacterized protein n=1 Tax=Paenibacillus methanolicus TaxID=582686 RepID=A0A5S5CJM8_9BACL|nr:hypothetical protein BCM02_101223 [Paenibacillus methanolicus]
MAAKRDAWRPNTKLPNTNERILACIQTPKGVRNYRLRFALHPTLASPGLVKSTVIGRKKDYLFMFRFNPNRKSTHILTQPVTEVQPGKYRYN